MFKRYSVSLDEPLTTAAPQAIDHHPEIKHQLTVDEVNTRFALFALVMHYFRAQYLLKKQAKAMSSVEYDSKDADPASAKAALATVQAKVSVLAAVQVVFVGGIQGSLHFRNALNARWQGCAIKKHPALIISGTQQPSVKWNFALQLK